ncbi:MAG: hypothetical protein CMO20_03130 [Thermoplasmata archaeon]|nr:hypothetical protein [Thermoplasmata archaeon]|tara:strand:+ start:352 stop:594 length:243 start_codon:yes stop_codon:yes gene_type:complete
MNGFVRGPSDEEEAIKALRAIAHGAGITIADFAEGIIGEPVDEEFVNSLISIIQMAELKKEILDLKNEIIKLWKWRRDMT